MKAATALFAAALLTASAVQAQTQPEAKPSDTAPPAAAATPPAKLPGNTVSGVTVEPPKAPQKACSSRDKDCIALVVAELKARYPKQLQRWCNSIEWQAAATNMSMDDFIGSSPGATSQSGMFYALPVAKVACARDPKTK